MDAMGVSLVGSDEFIHAFGGSSLVVIVLDGGRIVLLSDEVHFMLKFLAELILQTEQIIVGNSGESVAALALCIL